MSGAYLWHKLKRLSDDGGLNFFGVLRLRAPPSSQDDGNYNNCKGSSRFSAAATYNN
jgi:hypothetical protein